VGGESAHPSSCITSSVNRGITASFCQTCDALAGSYSRAGSSWISNEAAITDGSSQTFDCHETPLPTEEGSPWRSLRRLKPRVHGPPYVIVQFNPVPTKLPEDRLAGAPADVVGRGLGGCHRMGAVDLGYHAGKSCDDASCTRRRSINWLLPGLAFPNSYWPNFTHSSVPTLPVRMGSCICSPNLPDHRTRQHLPRQIPLRLDIAAGAPHAGGATPPPRSCYGTPKRQDAMPTIGSLRGVPPSEPSNWALPKVKRPPSEATSQ
jgi:hypothetical protein